MVRPEDAVQFRDQIPQRSLGRRGVARHAAPSRQVHAGGEGVGVVRSMGAREVGDQIRRRGGGTRRIVSLALPVDRLMPGP